MRVARLTMQAEDGKKLPRRAGAFSRGGPTRSGVLMHRFGARLLPERDRPRHANLGPLDRLIFGAVAMEIEHEIGLNRDANVQADVVFELEPQHGLFRGFDRNDMERQNHVVAITDGIAASAIGKSLRRRPQHPSDLPMGPAAIRSVIATT